MNAIFGSSAKSIGELLGSNERAPIIVPQFQRGYSWERKHVEAFWRDIIAFHEESAQKEGPDKYFLGPIVVLDPTKERILLLDGQQRLATATILIAVLRNAARSLRTTGADDFARDQHRDLIVKREDGEPAYSLVLGELDGPYFRQTVQADHAPESNKKPTLRSHLSIDKAKAFLSDAVARRISGQDPVMALKNLRELATTVRSDLVMTCIFVRSQREAFRIFETLNDRGLRLSVPDLFLNYLMGEAENDDGRKSIREMWNEMLEQMGKRDIGRFLRHFWVSKKGDLKKTDLFTALTGSIGKSRTAALDFALECAAECQNYTEILDAKDADLGEAAPHVRNLMRVLDVQPAMPLLLSCYKRVSPTEFATIVRWLLVFATRYSVFAELDSSGLESTLFELARDVRLALTDEKRRRPVMPLIKDKLVSGAPTNDKVIVASSSLVLSPEHAKYVVGRLAGHMQTKTRELKTDDTNLEHIFPKKPSAEWKNCDEMEPLLWHLGNLTALGTRLNAAAGSRGYDHKRTIYGGGSELIMAQDIAKTYNRWNADTVKERATRLGKMAVEVWNFDNAARV
jgi:Protein of unknown function DUF262/Protein of unknown function (DUF1524)